MKNIIMAVNSVTQSLNAPRTVYLELDRDIVLKIKSLHSLCKMLGGSKFSSVVNDVCWSSLSVQSKLADIGVGQLTLDSNVLGQLCSMLQKRSIKMQFKTITFSDKPEFNFVGQYCDGIKNIEIETQPIPLSFLDSDENTYYVYSH